MIPQIENQLEYESEDIEEVKSPSKTYKLNKNINTVKTTLGEKEVIEGSEIYIDDAGVQTASITEIQGKSEQAGEPSPTNPSEIHSVADDVNLFDKEANVLSSANCTYTYENGIYIITNTNNYNPVVVLENILPKGKYILNSDNYLSVATQIRNSNGDTLANCGSNYQNKTFEISSDADRIYFNWATTSNPIILNLNSLKIQKGLTATPYSPYNQGTVTIKQRGKNLINNNNLQYDYSNIDNSFNQLETLETGIRYTTTYPAGFPVVVFNTGIDLTNYIGKTIKMKSTISSGGEIRIGVANADTSSRQDKAHTDINNQEISFVVPDNLGEKKYLIYYLAIDVGIGNTTDFKNLTLTIDEEPIYEPYQGNDYTIQTEPLRSLPNGVKDTIEEDGIHRRVGRYILPKLTELSSGTVLGTQCQYASTYSLPNSKTGGRNYNFISNIIAPANEIYGQYKGFKNSTNIVVMTSTDDTLENFNSKISGAEVLYELAEEVIEPFTEAQQEIYNELQELSIYNKTLQITTSTVPEPTFVLEYYPKSSVIKEIIEVDKIAGFVDDIEAIKQSAYHILSIERYSYIIYDDDYGVELEQYIGQNLDYIEATIQDTLEEALTQDERIIGVQVTNIEKTNIDCVHIEFVLICDTGEIEMEVDINV